MDYLMKGNRKAIGRVQVQILCSECCLSVVSLSVQDMPSIARICRSTLSLLQPSRSKTREGTVIDNRQSLSTHARYLQGVDLVDKWPSLFPCTELGFQARQ